jgi:hypothetical protein
LDGDTCSYVRYCDKAGGICRDTYPDKCPYFIASRAYRAKKAAYEERRETGIKEYYAVCAKTGKNPTLSDAADYVLKFAGPAPVKEEQA